MSTAGPGAVFHHDVPVVTVGPAGPGTEGVFSVRICWNGIGNGTNLDLHGALAFPGRTLPELAACLRDVDDPGWPRDARLLRALIAPDDQDAGPALERYACLPGYNLARSLLRCAAHWDPFEAARAS